MSSHKAQKNPGQKIPELESWMGVKVQIWQKKKKVRSSPGGAGEPV